MPKLPSNSYPKLRLHKASGQAVVTLSGRDHYCGAYGSPEAESRYHRLIAEWVANGRRTRPDSRGLTVGKLAQAWSEWAQSRFVKRGEPTSYARRVKRVAERVEALYGSTPIEDFGPTALKAVRASWVESGCSRTVCNHYTQAVLNLFRWGVAEDLVPPTALTRLEAIPGLSARDQVRDSPGVGPVPRADLEAAIAALWEPGVSILRLMACTGLRPGEACTVRPCDLNRTGEPWWYAVVSDWNKTAHRGRTRNVPLGPKAREVLVPWLITVGSPDSYLFRNRTGQGPYRRQTLYVVTEKACRRADVPRFHPNQVRHLYLSEVRARFGLEAAQVIAGHSSLTTTQVYTEADRNAGARIAQEMG